MLLLTAGFGASLLTASFGYTPGVGVTMVAIILCAWFGGSAERKRSIIYGAMGGVVLLLVSLWFVDWAWYGRLPVSHVYRTEPRAAQICRPYIFPVGGFCGALAGYVLVDWLRWRGKQVGAST